MSDTAVLPDLIAEAQTSEEPLPAPDLRPRSDGRVVEASPDHGSCGWRPLLGHSRERYLDALSGIYVVAVGHNNRRVIDAVRQQLDTLSFSPPMHGTNPVAIQLANLLAELAPGDLSTVKFQCGGSEVTEAAIKLARQYHKLTGHPGKYKVISRYQSWHGSTLASLSASGLKSRAPSTSRWLPVSCTSSRRPATVAPSARVTPIAASPAPRSSAT